MSGQCYEALRGDQAGYSSAPNGLQLVLRRAHGLSDHPEGWPDVKSDTLVMRNLGYFQLQAQPGLWNVSIAEGKGSALYSIDAVGAAVSSRQSAASGPSKPGSEVQTAVPVTRFSSERYGITVSKRPGMENIPLLEEVGADGASVPSEAEAGGVVGGGGIFSSIHKIIGGGSAKANSDTAVTTASASDEDNKIHVFSLATGHLYERLLRIMMLSVHSTSSMPVKFWLFENYLSPKFKETAARMAAHYGFEVAYVTYKWPEWLTQQSEKQRIIWGYKILFLDVLFPLNVKKVIYVDADQVVRADLKELWGMDLEGKPYAYTPFCDSREETLGFQFWRSGYWADHLRGHPYHISALYVVDLAVFRRNAVGDTLRATYDMLARDPNSLANLDQDLPNYAQHQVPIFSLPQEWLWCESWCSDESKAKAKTIDLCNNPLHKESKLDMAKRVIAEKELFPKSWIELDEEVHKFELD